MESPGLIVLDTCALIWLVSDPKLLTRVAYQSIFSAMEDRRACFSTISYWEIAHAFSRNKIIFEKGFREFIAVMNGAFQLTEISIQPDIAELSVSFPPEINNDPADRIIAATSIILHASLITADKNLCKSKLIKTIW